MWRSRDPNPVHLDIINTYALYILNQWCGHEAHISLLNIKPHGIFTPISSPIKNPTGEKIL
jgi:hypothetical protein